MRRRKGRMITWAALGVLHGLVVGAGPLPAQWLPASHAPTPASPPVRLVLEEARQRALANSKVIALAAGNVQAKEYATRVVRADYFPQILGMALYFHFDNPLGQVVTFSGKVTPGASPLAIEANVFNQDSSTATVYAAQPITALLKVRQGVAIARADEQIAQADVEKARRAISAGVEQLFWGVLAAQRIRAGTLVALAGAEQLAKTGAIEARLALLETRQGLQQVDAQLADLQAQLNDLLDLPPCTKLELVEPPLPVIPVTCCDEAVNLAVGASPEVRAAEQDVVKARAAVAAAKVDYLPNVALVGGYAKQTFANYMQQDFNYVGLIGSYTFFSWGKRRNTVRERDQFVALAELKVEQTRDEVRQNALKAFRELQQDREALQTAQEMAQARKEAEKQAAAPAARFAAAKDLMQAEVDLVKADLAYRIACVKLLSLLGK
jgi:outer membrane protein TolC